MSRDGQTHVRVDENLNQIAGALFGGGGAGGGLGIGIGVGLPIGINVFGSALLAVAFPLGFTALTFVAMREIYRGVVKGRRRAMSDLFDKIVNEVLACVERRAIEGDDAPGQLPAG